MGVRILYDPKQGEACFFCSTSGWAFGPTFGDGGKALDYKDGQERAEAFLRWTDTTETWGIYQKHPSVFVRGSKRDPRELTDAGMEAAYTDWLAQEAEQYRREACEAVEEGRG